MARAHTNSSSLAVTAPPQPDQAAAAVPRLRQAAGNAAPAAWVVVFALAVGLLYLAVAPPWQHYDEPTHFEYARLIALGYRDLTPVTVDLSTRQAIASSMYVWRAPQPAPVPDIFSPVPPDLGLSQLVHPPLYYALISWPVRWTLPFAVEVQLYAARLVSVALFALTVLCAWRIAVVVTPANVLPWLVVPVVVACTPAFSDIMSGVNNDVLVNFAVAAMLLGCVYLIRDGIRPLPLLLAVIALLVALLTKRTAVIAAPALALALLWALWRRPLPWRIALPMLVLLAAVAMVIGFRVDPDQQAAGFLAARRWLIEIDQAYLRLNVNALIHSLTDWERSQPAYAILLPLGFFSFWQHMSWGSVTLPPAWNWATLGLALAAAAGLLVQVRRMAGSLARWQQRCIWLFFWITVTAWLALLVRVHPLPPPGEWFYVPRGRYMHQTMIPVAWLMLWGLLGLAPRRWQPLVAGGLMLYFVALGLFGLATLVGVYYG